MRTVTMNLHLPQLTAREEDLSHSPNNPKAMRRWLKDLPLVNMGESTKLMFTTLKVLNRQSIDYRVRFEIMELLRPTARMILKHLQRHFAAITLPISGRNRQIDRLTDALLQELSVGYKHVVHDIATGRDRTDRKLLATAIHRAMRYLNELLLRGAALYKPDPRNAWHDLHRLQGLAELHKLSGLEVPDEDYRTIEASSIDDVYKQACLLAISGPLRLRTGEAERLATYFETACHLSEMKRTLSPDGKGLVHVASLKSSEPPAFIPLADITTFSNLRGFDLTRLISTLKDMLSELQTEHSTGQSGFSKIPLDKRLLERLLHSWTTRERRRFSRVSTNRTIVTALGLTNIIQAINADSNPYLNKSELFFDKQEAETLQPQHATLAGLSPAYSMTGELEFVDGAYYDHHATDQMLRPHQVEKRALPDSWLEWTVINTGAGGYGLLWNADTPINLHVGELIALRDKEYDEYQWRVGIVRWLRHRTDSGVEVGVQLISPRGTVVQIDDIRNRTHPDILPIEGLMLPGMRTIKQMPSLLVPARSFLPDDVLELRALGKKLCLQLKQTGEHSTYYTQFFYRSTEVKEQVDAREEFEDLWNRL
ncbi:MAG: hypothetical protein ACFCUJ_00375 [Thiotrichales bacterium]